MKANIKSTKSQNEADNLGHRQKAAALLQAKIQSFNALFMHEKYAFRSVISTNTRVEAASVGSIGNANFAKHTLTRSVMCWKHQNN